MSEFSHRLVAVMNEKIETGKVMNALAHMCVGLGAFLGQDSLQLMDYMDADRNIHPNISKMTLVVLKANSNKISKLREEAHSRRISCTDFIDTMTVGSWSDQQARTLQTKQQDLVYYGIMLFGDKDSLTELTKKFSLWK